MSDEAMLASIAEIGRLLPASGAHELAAVIEVAGTPEKLVVRADGLATPVLEKGALQLADAWGESSLSSDAIAFGLRAAQAAAATERERETIDLVWTGPKSKQVAVMRNDEALYEVVKTAQEQLLIVSYATYQMPDLLVQLSKAVDRGVSVDLVLEFHGGNADQPQEWDPVKGLGGALPDGVQVYQWPVETREQTDWGKVGYLHVKAAVGDRKTAFVSSANLTVYAMEMNMELGVLVRGGDVPARIAGHFAALIDEGTLERWEG
jgi:phosphatidylserine/phosphatidylglycerophosphate/cardiolipin synthase-like enzyme